MRGDSGSRPPGGSTAPTGRPPLPRRSVERPVRSATTSGALPAQRARSLSDPDRPALSGSTGEPGVGLPTADRSRQSISPAGTTHRLRWPVTAAIRSKSLSQWKTVRPSCSAAAATSRSGILRPRWLRSARIRWTCSARWRWLAVISTRGKASSAPRSWSHSAPFLAEYPTSRSQIAGRPISPLAASGSTAVRTEGWGAASGRWCR